MNKCRIFLTENWTKTISILRHLLVILISRSKNNEILVAFVHGKAKSCGVVEKILSLEISVLWSKIRFWRKFSKFYKKNEY